MIITHRKFPVLPRLEKSTLGVIGYFEEDKAEFISLKEKIPHLWKSLCPFFNQRVRVISESFVESFNLAKAKLNIPELYEKVESQSGTVIAGDTTTCYAVYNCADYLSVQFVKFYKDVLVAVCENFNYEEHTKKKSTHFFWASKAIWGEDGATQEKMHREMGEVLLLINFFRYAEVETKLLPANKKVKDITCKYLIYSLV